MHHYTFFVGVGVGVGAVGVGVGVVVVVVAVGVGVGAIQFTMKIFFVLSTKFEMSTNLYQFQI